MPSVHTIKGIIGSVSKHANTILATLREEFARKDIINIIQELSDVPLRTQDISRSITVVDNSLQDWNRMKFARRDSILRSGYARVKDPGRRAYSTIVKSRVTHETTGETFDSFVTVTHDEPLTRREIENSAEDMITDFGERPYLTVDNQSPVQAFTFQG